MPLASFAQLFAEADRRPVPVPVAAVGGADRTVLEARRTACDRRWVVPFVIGQEKAIRAVADAHATGGRAKSKLHLPQRPAADP